ncbi:MAG: efflux RND transporter periplasmic adaptor subunit [Chromatiaceae bacterium]|nr:efflux RND transporter periplasmic adaptor subunit [Chromatiaceae bacterium]MCP5441685.1 efflux RND transporter periplasmic adaptor subunit [Chromatiaceae bacterium]
MPKKPYKLLISLAAVLAAAVALFAWFGRVKPIEVIVKPIAFGKVQHTVANTRAGTIKACRRAGISPSIGGQIAGMPVKEGDLVKPGQLLMELWNHDRLAQLELATSEADAAAANARQACIRADVALREAHRLMQLKKSNLASDEAADKADGEARAQQAACNAARATKKVSEAKIRLVESELEQTRLTAPFAGIVAEVNGEIGEFVTPSPVGIPTPPAVDLVDVGCLYVSAPIDEVDAPQIRVGMPARISLDAMSQKIFAGKVRRIAPYVLEREKQARTLDVEVDFLCPEECEGMLPGYSADIEVIIREQDKSLRVPTEAVLEGNKVLLFTSDNTLQQREIKAGLSNWEWTEVTEGLSEGEEIVISVDREGVEDGVAAVRDKND